MPTQSDYQPAQTAPDGRHPRGGAALEAAPDSLLQELAVIAERDSFLDHPVREQFAADGFTVPDLFLGAMANFDYVDPSGLDGFLRYTPGDPAWWSAQDAPPTLVQYALALLGLLDSANRPIAAGAAPDTKTFAQRRLSKLLLDYPVLLHPRLHVRQDSAGGGVSMSFAHAMMWAGGSFPRMSHFEPGELSEQALKRFANSHHLTRCLTTGALPIPSLAAYGMGTSVVLAAARKFRSCPQLLLSLHELGQLLDDPGRERRLGPFLGAWSSITAGAQAPELHELVASSFLEAAGVRPMHVPSHDPAPLPEPGFAAIAAGVPRDEFLNSLRDELFAGLTVTLEGDRPDQQIADAVRLVLDALVAADVFPDTPSGATWIRGALSAIQLPNVDTRSAITTLRAIGTAGAPVSPEHAATSPEPQPESWLAAAAAVSAERTMRDALALPTEQAQVRERQSRRAQL